ncbi:hypothetical protein ACV3J7_07135 [Salmonella enterica]
MINEPKGSFPCKKKEPILERIFQLIEERYPSRSAAARAWGININTLKGYYHKQETQNAPPVPRRGQLLKIAEAEGVSVEWLLTGTEKETKDQKKQPMQPNQLETANKKAEIAPVEQNDADRKLSALLSFLSNDEKTRLVEMLARKGVEAALLILDEDMVKIAHAKPVVKKAALMLNDLPDARVREILAEIEGTERAQVDTLNKKAG